MGIVRSSSVAFGIGFFRAILRFNRAPYANDEGKQVPLGCHMRRMNSRDTPFSLGGVLPTGSAGRGQRDSRQKLDELRPYAPQQLPLAANLE